VSARAAGTALALLIGASALHGQTLERRIASAPEGNVQFHFAARAGVCGNGAGILRTDDGSSYYTGFGNDYGRSEQCSAGPIRVVVVRMGREIIKLETFAGPLAATPESGADLGSVSAREAATWLLGQSTALEGRPARDAILPAVLADSTTVTPTLAAIVRDRERSRDLRRNAISWLSRRRNESGGVGAAAVTRQLEGIVRDRSENESIRSSALSAIASLDRGEGVTTMMAFARETDPWLARQAWSSLSRSGDPRARQFAREGLRQRDVSDELRVLAIQGVGGDYATGADYRTLRELYPTLNSDRERDAVISALGNAGGRDNIDWLLTVAESKTEPAARRRRIVSLLGRLDEPRIREALREMAEK
jgi:hypothetical protein